MNNDSEKEKKVNAPNESRNQYALSKPHNDTYHQQRNYSINKGRQERFFEELSKPAEDNYTESWNNKAINNQKKVSQ